MNSSVARFILESLNPGIGFEVGDVNRLPLFLIHQPTKSSAASMGPSPARTGPGIVGQVKRPGPSPWKYAQEWAQVAVDRPAGASLAEYLSREEPPGRLDDLSYRLGLALGRFDDRGIAEVPQGNSITQGILFLSATGGPDSREHPAAADIREQADYLRTKFFADDHLKRYEKRPIYFPLSSKKKSFVAWCAIHRWTDQTLHYLLADYLVPEQNRLAAELADAAAALGSGDRKAQAAAHRRRVMRICWAGSMNCRPSAARSRASPKKGPRSPRRGGRKGVSPWAPGKSMPNLP